MVFIKKLGVASVAKMLGALYTTLGLIYGLFFGLFMLAMMGLGGNQAAIFGIIFGIAIIFITPIAFGLMGAIIGALMAFLYNIIAGKFGGIEIELSEK